jgi:hypothetical protein
VLVDITNNHSAFQNTLNEVALGNWVKLMECPKCGQLWKVDEWDKYQVLYAVKVPAKEDWENFDSESLIKEKMVVNRGGLTESKCIWVGCKKIQVKGSAYCIDHLYKTGVRK